MEKEELITYCLNHLEEKSDSLLKEIKDLQEAIASETKSSAGDKYETGREMMTQERDKIQAQIDQINKHRSMLRSIDLSKVIKK